MGMEITDRDVLLVIDVQNDFCDGGALPVPDGQEVVPVIHRIAEAFTHAFSPRIGTHRIIIPSLRIIQVELRSKPSRPSMAPMCFGPTTACKEAWARLSTLTCSRTIQS